ncbi:MAG: NAD(P)/FAD-dependent oxidoreductase [Chloroflexi bacterium]|nr:MAG: NAD(P)/FAD-dependent oxidoreductase [Chloroflexota bacterium]
MNRKRIPSTAWIFIAFIPWIAYWVLAGMGWVLPGVIAALIGALGLNLYRLRTGNPKLMDGVTLAFFALHLLFTGGLGSRLFLIYGGGLVYLALALMAWGSLAARTPFTYQYARDDWPREYWQHPLFRRTNEIITLAWAVIFTLGVALNAAALKWPAYKITLAMVIPAILLVPGVLLSLYLPRWFPRHALAREIERRDRPFGWRPPRFSQEPPTASDEFDVIVIGAGMGGLTAAALLAKRGLKTLVVEQAHYVGGFCAHFHRLYRRYTFDIGVHDISGLGPRGPVRHLLRELGIEARLEFLRMPHEYILGDLRLRVPEDADAFVEELAARFPTERDALRAFFAEMRHVYREMYTDDGRPDIPTDPEAMLRYPLTHPHLLRWRGRSYLGMLDAYFTDERLKGLLRMLTAYQTDRPETLTVMQMAPIFGYYFDGGFYPKGGSGRLPQAVAEAFQAYGGTLLLRKRVEQILVKEGTAYGVRLADGGTFRARAVLSNADPGVTFRELVGLEHLPQDYAALVQALQPTVSIFAVFLALDYDPPIAPITMYRAPDGTEVGFAVPSKVDPTLAPPGHHVMTLMTLVPQPEAATWNRKAPDYKARKAAMADRLVRRAEGLLPGLRDHIVTRDAATPATVTRYTGHPAGAIYGSVHPGGRLPLQTPIRHLYLVGASTQSGGVEAVVISGRRVADMLIPEGERATYPSKARRATYPFPLRKMGRISRP